MWMQSWNYYEQAKHPELAELRVTNNSQIFVGIPASVERKFFRLISQ